jgi:hypothetical protein
MSLVTLGSVLVMASMAMSVLVVVGVVAEKKRPKTG